MIIPSHLGVNYWSPSMPTRNLTSLGNIVSRMKISSDGALYEKIKPLGCSDLFNYATNKRYKRSELVSCYLDRFGKVKATFKPLNGIEELIRLTEEGKLWRFPIDNEQGLDAEKKVPFEEHVFLEDHLEDFPKTQYVQSFMKTVTSGLARNHWMSVDRKLEVINFYKDFFTNTKI